MGAVTTTNQTNPYATFCFPLCEEINVNMPTSSLPVAPQVRSILDGFQRAIGIGNRVTLQWDRTGAATFELIGGKTEFWTAERIYGRLGRFSANCSHLPIAVNNPYLQYELCGSNNDDLRLTAGVELPGFAARLTPISSQVVSAREVGSPVGSIGITTVFGVLSLVWALLHPRITLNLPGTIELNAVLVDANTLQISFKTPLTITVVWGLQFSCTPNQLTLTEHAAVVQYKSGWFARTQEWSWSL